MGFVVAFAEGRGSFCHCEPLEGKGRAVVVMMGFEVLSF